MKYSCYIQFSILYIYIYTLKIRCTFQSMHQYIIMVLKSWLNWKNIHIYVCILTVAIWYDNFTIQSKSTKSTDERKKMHSDINLYTFRLFPSHFMLVVISFEKVVLRVSDRDGTTVTISWQIQSKDHLTWL